MEEQAAAATTAESTNSQAAAATAAKEKGNEHFAKGEYVLAVNAYNQAIKADPNNHVLYSNRSAAFLKLEKEVRALKDAQTAIDLNSTWVKGYFRKAACLEKLQKYEEALDVLKQADALEPSNKEVSTLMKQVLQHHPRGQEEAAKIRMERAKAAKLAAAKLVPAPATTETSSTATTQAASTGSSAEEAAAVNVISTDENYSAMVKNLVPGAPIPFSEELVDSFFQEILSMVLGRYTPGSTMTPTAYFQPGFLSKEGKDELGCVGIEKAFESPETTAQCLTFLRQYGEDFRAHAAVLIVPKSSIAFPQVWTQNKRDWPCSQDAKGVFLQLESKIKRRVIFIPLKRDSSGLNTESIADLNPDRFSLMPRLFKQ